MEVSHLKIAASTAAAAAAALLPQPHCCRSSHAYTQFRKTLIAHRPSAGRSRHIAAETSR